MPLGTQTRPGRLAAAAEQVLAMSDVLSKQVAEGKIKVVAAYFDIGTGKVEFFDAG